MRVFLNEAEYEGREVELDKPFRLSGDDNKKFGVYVKNPDTGNVIKVKFGDPDMEIKRDDDEARKAFRARHNCDDKDDKTTAGYWSCKMWQAGTTVSDMLNEEEFLIRCSVRRAINEILNEIPTDHKEEFRLPSSREVKVYNHGIAIQQDNGGFSQIGWEDVKKLIDKVKPYIR